jgi:hypothetical protein
MEESQNTQKIDKGFDVTKSLYERGEAGEEQQQTEIPYRNPAIERVSPFGYTSYHDGDSVRVGKDVYQAGPYISDEAYRYAGAPMKIESRTMEDPAYSNALLDQQIAQESYGVTNIVSHAGAKGLTQFNDVTWAEAKRLGFINDDDNQFDPGPALKAQKMYMQHLYNSPNIKKAGTREERFRRMLAAYNNGITNVNRLINDYGNEWYKYIPKQTTEYIDKILTGLRERTYSGEYTPVYNRNFNH